MSVIGVHIVRLFGMELSRHTLARACLSAVVVSGGLVPFHFRKHLPVWVRVACLALIFASIGICCVWNFRIMRSHVENPPEWDFRVFWMYGKVLARHGNVYLPSEYQEFKELFQSDTQFTEASLNVGATYPPHSMLLFEPLGFSNIHTAYLLWYVLQTAALVAAIELLRRIFLGGSGVWGLGLAALLLFALRGTWVTINFGQTNFLVLLLILLYWCDHELPRAGVWLALGILVKLYVVFLLLYPLLRRQWLVVAWTVVSSLLLAFASLLVLGPTTFFSYFTLHPASHLPSWVYSERINQSLLAVILRNSNGGLGNRGPLAQPLFLALALLLACVTSWLVYRLRRRCEYGLALVLVLTLLLYPGTLVHYTLILLIPLLVIWEYREDFPGGIWGTVGLIAFVYGSIALQQGDSTFAAMLLVWMVLAGLAVFRTQNLQTIQPEGSDLLTAPHQSRFEGKTFSTAKTSTINRLRH
ncbi:MAG: hypothetical protein DMG75_12330 [Acidobacteria bacterium]|nr:MAG: hypothetical protein DMG75_12330 [Acidobacteriota bacterium]